MLEIIGNTAMITQTVMRAGKPYPIQIPISGTSARIGIVWRMTA